MMPAPHGPVPARHVPRVQQTPGGAEWWESYPRTEYGELGYWNEIRVPRWRRIMWTVKAYVSVMLRLS